jgi:hypothetical protein
VNATLGRGGAIDRWGFMRVVDVTDADPANWRAWLVFGAALLERTQKERAALVEAMRAELQIPD